MTVTVAPAARRRIALWLAIGALLLRAALPPGLMPAARADGGIAIVICAAAGAKTVVVDAGGRPAEREHSRAADCPFAWTPPVDLPAAAASALPSRVVAAATPSAGRSAAIGVRPDGAPGARAPPSAAMSA
ncbi:MAG: DUF2946 domain-containing protein [Alphaproteobacteria bacterium]